MKIVFVASVLNNHILPFCNELNFEHDFIFIATRNYSVVNQVTHSKKPMQKDFVLNYFEKEQRQKCIEKVLEADIAIFGGSSSELLKLRKKTNKISFIYTERFFKKGNWRRFIPSTAKTLREQFLENNKNLYVLCAGSFVSRDLKLIGFDTRRCFRFGYFPFVESKELQNLLDKKNNEVPKFLYVGRLLDWKRVKDIIKCCKKLKSKNILFELNIVGDGPERKKLEKMCAVYGLDTVCFLGAKQSNEVFELMEQSNALFISSNRFEGWGAVVNEAMHNACPIIASNACGSTAYLIKDSVNGYVYKSANVKDLCSKIILFLQNQHPDIYINAYNTVKNEWNAVVAAERFLTISEELIHNKSLTDFEKGPMSKEIV